MRSGMILAAGTATYFGGSQLGSLASFGMRILQDLEPTSNTVSNSRESRITWNDVSGSFWGSWGLFARYMGRRD